MPRRTLATRLFAELARRCALRNAPPNPDPVTAEIPGALSEPGNARAAAPQPTVGTLLYLGSLGVVATATAGVFFGIGFLLLAYPREEMVAGFSAREGGVEIEFRRSDLFPRADTDAPPVQPATAPAQPVPSTQALEAQEGLPPAGALPGGSYSGEMSTSAEATLVPPAGITHAKRAGVGRHRHAGTRRHWVAVSQPGAIGRSPPAVSGPERAWRWIVRSATSLLASLSPPPSWRTPGLKTR
jgi:hypothetical protein